MSAALLAGVAVAGAIGALLRDVVDGWLSARTPDARLPVGILVVNVTGSLALGLLLGAGDRLDAAWLAVLGSGLLGAFTTFSTFAVQVCRLPRRDAVTYVAVTVVCCLDAAAAGMAVF